MPPSNPKDPSSPKPKVASSPSSPWWKWPLRILMWLLGLAAAGALALALVIAVALAFAYPNLPDISDLADYRPKLPLRVYSSEGALLGEFGEARGEGVHGLLGLGARDLEGVGHPALQQPRAGAEDDDEGHPEGDDEAAAAHGPMAEGVER